MKRTKTNMEEGQAQRESGETRVQMEEGASTTTTSSSRKSSAVVASGSSSRSAAPASSSSGNDVATRTTSSVEESGTSRVDGERKAQREHKDDPERADEKLLRTEENMWNTNEEEEASLLRKTVKYLATLERAEVRKESGDIGGRGIGRCGCE